MNKNTSLFVIFAVSLMLGLSSCGSKSTANKMDNFVDSLMAQMTIEEKLGQLNLPVTGDIVTGQAQSSDIAGAIRAGRVGGLFNLKGSEAIREIQRIAVEESRLGIPLVFGMDVIHGYETVFPIPLAIACTWDEQAVEMVGRISALEATADGICWTFSPMVDICCDARWGRIAESFGEDPYLVSTLAKAMVKGYQQTDLSDTTSMMACVKHFALYGAPEGGRDYNNVELSRYRMYNDYLPPYRATVEAGVGSVMASFNTVEGVPATCNSWLLTDLLRNDWGFKGFVVSDYTAIAEMLNHGVAADLREAAELSLKAGLDMDMVSHGLLLLQDDPKLVEYVNQACRRILVAKHQLGLFENPYRYCNSERRQKDILTQSNRDDARRVARESFVLLKNEKNTLPLKKQSTIALIGPLANTRANMSGTWAVAAVSDKYKTLKEGLEDAVKGKGKVLYAKGCNLTYDPVLEAHATMFGREMRDNRSVQALRDEALRIARQADVIVAAMGESSEFSGECASRTDLTMPDAQADLLKELKETGKPIVLLNFSGRPVILNWEAENLPAILQVWFGGSETADAVADVIFGDYTPSGKLAVAFPRSVGQLPMTYRHYNTGRPLPEGEDKFHKFVSCYMDCPNSPLYPFGFGLTYTQLDYGTLALNQNTLSKANKEVKATIEVKNTGKYDADEIVQLYIRDVVCNPVRPIAELRSWQKIHLAAGESKTVEFTITPDMLGFYTADGLWTVPTGEYHIMVGANSRDLQKLALQYEE